MRIWFVHQYALPPDRPGGSRHHALARALIAAGHQVLVVAAGRHYQTSHDATSYDADGERQAEVAGVPFLWLRTSAYQGNTPRRLVNMASFAWRVLRSPTLRRAPAPDVVLGSSPQPLAALAARWLARRHRARFLYEIRDLWPATLVEGGALGARHPLVMLFAAIERRCLRDAERVITVLPEARPYLIARGAIEGRVAWIPNGVDLELASSPAPLPPATPFRFIYAGALGVANGVDQLLEAVAILEQRLVGGEVEVCLIGTGPEEDRLRRMADGLRLASVRFERPVAREEIYSRLATGHVLLMILRPSSVFRWGVSPNKLFDYFAAGRPVLFAVRAANDPVAEAACGLSVDPASPAAIADGMWRMAQMPASELAAMGARARRYVEARHDMDVLGAQLADLVTDGRSS